MFFDVLNLEGVAGGLVEDNGVVASVVNSLVDGVQELIALPVFSPLSVGEPCIVVNDVGEFGFLALILL